MLNVDMIFGIAGLVVLYFTGLFVILLTNKMNKLPQGQVPVAPSYDTRLKDLALMSTPVFFDFEAHLKPLVECIHREVRERISDFKIEFRSRTNGSNEYYMSLAEANKMSEEICNTVKDCLSVEYLCTLSRYRSIQGIGRLTKQIVNELIVQEADIINSTVYNEEVNRGMAKAKMKKEVKNMDSGVQDKVAEILGISKDDLQRAANSPEDVFNAFLSGINKPL